MEPVNVFAQPVKHSWKWPVKKNKKTKNKPKTKQNKNKPKPQLISPKSIVSDFFMGKLF